MKISESIINRKGARKATDIPSEVLDLLHAGKLATVNLTEWLAVDQLQVLETVLGEIAKMPWLAEIKATVLAQPKISANNNTKTIGLCLEKLIEGDEVITSYLANHQSDIVRAWACWLIAAGQTGTNALLQACQPFAADAHFGIREVVIFATKERLASDLENAIAALAKWTSSTDENIRRYAVETLRPTGVWTKKIPALHADPALGLPILEPLKADPAKYVQHAVANWLNDASKSQPQWVVELCKNWETVSPSPATTYIVKRALRTVNKQ